MFEQQVQAALSHILSTPLLAFCYVWALLAGFLFGTAFDTDKPWRGPRHTNGFDILLRALGIVGVVVPGSSYLIVMDTPSLMTPAAILGGGSLGLFMLFAGFGLGRVQD